jgi:hypothetical protein
METEVKVVCKFYQSDLQEILFKLIEAKIGIKPTEIKVNIEKSFDGTHAYFSSLDVIYNKKHNLTNAETPDVVKDGPERRLDVGTI